MYVRANLYGLFDLGSANLRLNSIVERQRVYLTHICVHICRSLYIDVYICMLRSTAIVEPLRALCLREIQKM